MVDFMIQNGDEKPCWMLWMASFHCLVVEPTPLKNHGVRQLGCLFPIYGKVKVMFQSTKQFQVTLW